MPLPEFERVIYRKNPLEEVICQLRFPPILRIDAELPAAFQDAIRDQYPLYQEQGQNITPPEVPAAVAKLLPPGWPGETQSRVHIFMASDEQWAVTLSREAVSLTARSYEQWVGFRNRLENILRVLVEQYSPPFYSRIGLRYKDVIRRSQLGLKNEAWAELLQPHIAGELSRPELANEIDRAARQFGIRFPQEKGQVLVRHGLASDTDTEEMCFLIDGDYSHTEKTETQDALELLDYFNRQAGCLFRWCITDRLHIAMEPTSP